MRVDTTIIAAIIGSIATILAAIIGVLSHKCKVATDKQRFEKSKSLKLGYILAALEWHLKAQKFGLTSFLPSGFVSAGIEMQSRHAREIAKALGISTNPDPNALGRDLFVTFDTKPIAVKKAFEVGYIIGRIYCICIAKYPFKRFSVFSLAQKIYAHLKQSSLVSNFLSSS